MAHTVWMPPDHPTASDGRLVSGDAVELDIRLARVGSRMLARLIDLLVQAVVFGALYLVATAFIALAGASVDGALVAALLTIILIAVVVGYPTIAESASGGRSLGKLAMGLRVIRNDGGPVRFRHALTRALVAAAVEFPGLVLLPLTWVACLWTMLVDRQGRRIGDLAAGTMVIHDRSPDTWGWVPAMPPALIGWAATLDLTGLPDELALSVRHFLARNRVLREPARSRLGFTLASEVAAHITPPAPLGTPGWAYLAAVLAERNRRSAVRLLRARRVAARVFPEVELVLTPAAQPFPAPVPAGPAPVPVPAVPLPVPGQAAPVRQPVAPGALRPASPVEPPPNWTARPGDGVRRG